jgi:hypothetical protein
MIKMCTQFYHDRRLASKRAKDTVAVATPAAGTEQKTRSCNVTCSQEQVKAGLARTGNDGLNRLEHGYRRMTLHRTKKA